mgnify:CR=1 FL=1
MKQLKGEFPDEELKLAYLLRGGGLIAFPTETVYGLGADAENSEALERLYEVKGRPKDHPVIVHIGNLDYLDYWAKEVPQYALDLGKRFWPGPMTLLLPRSNKALDQVTGGQEVVGIRIPSHPLAQELLNTFHRMGGYGVAAPSANRFGHVSPTNAVAVKDELGPYLSSEDLVIDGGQCEVGIESTIIDCTGDQPQILRLGAITEAMINEVTPISSSEAKTQVRVSGNLPRHYAPNAKILLNKSTQPGDGFLASASYETPADAIRLASPRNVEEFAHDLYQALRRADEMGLARVIVVEPEGDGLAAAIRDRLTRASQQ